MTKGPERLLTGKGVVARSYSLVYRKPHWSLDHARYLAALESVHSFQEQPSGVEPPPFMIICGPKLGAMDD